jgi:hypothetical protein
MPHRYDSQSPETVVLDLDLDLPDPIGAISDEDVAVSETWLPRRGHRRRGDGDRM